MINSVTRPVSGVDKRNSKQPAVWRKEWVAVIYLPGTEGGGTWRRKRREGVRVNMI